MTIANPNPVRPVAAPPAPFRLRRMVVRISEDTGRNLSRESTRRLVARNAPCVVIAVALTALSTPALATECSDYREKITTFDALISEFEKRGRFDTPAYQAAMAALNASQNAAIEARRGPTAPANFDETTAAKASIDASLVVASNASKSVKASADAMKAVIVTIPGASLDSPSALEDIDKVSDAVSVVSSLATKTFHSAAIASAIAWTVFHKAIYAAVCQ